MRPTDENQSPSMRPNLMSPRRTATSGEDSILAMLEREPARKRGGASGTRLAWYGTGAGLALALTGALVWLVANNDGRRPDAQDTMLADAVQAPPARPAPPQEAAPPLMQDAAVRQIALATPATSPEPQPGSAAVIVDQPPPADAAPPLRLLKPAPEKAAQEKPAPALRVPVPAPAPTPTAAAPARAVAKAAPASGPAAAASAAPAKPAAAAPAPAPAPATAKSKPVMVAKSAVRPAQPKAQRTVNPARTAADGAVDADVALISAVIVHANGHAPEGSQMTELMCPNDNCKSRPARE